MNKNYLKLLLKLGLVSSITILPLSFLVACQDPNYGKNFNLENNIESFKKLINFKKYEPWDIEELTLEIQKKYGDANLRVEKIEIPSFYSFELGSPNIERYKITGEKEDLQNGKYFGTIIVDHNWIEKIDSTIDISTQKENIFKIVNEIFEKQAINDFKTFLVFFEWAVYKQIDPSEFLEIKVLDFEYNGWVNLSFTGKGNLNNFGKYKGTLKLGINITEKLVRFY